MSNLAEDVTDISSPGEGGDRDDDDFGRKAPYHTAIELAEELKVRSQIHLEEQTCKRTPSSLCEVIYLTRPSLSRSPDVTALNLLDSLLCDGISHANSATTPAHIPPPAQLGMLATLAIQPKHTSKIFNQDAHDVAPRSLSYLRSILATVGPVNGKLRDAFLFRDDSGRRRRSADDLPRNGPESDEEHIRGRAANAGGVWTRGQDFWKVLGWAFNCSALYPHRWRWWKPWLEYMLDVLEADYEERRRLDAERDASQEENHEFRRMVQDSLLVSYIAPKNSRSSPVKPIMSALFADGGASSTSIYKEVFKKETMVASKTSQKRKRHRVDLENDNFGDYDEDSSTGGSEPPTPQHQRTAAKMVDDSVPWTTSTMVETIPLRLRLFAMVSPPNYLHFCLALNNFLAISSR